MQKTQIPSLGWEDPQEKEMAIHPSILAWKTPWIGEPGGLQCMGLQRVVYDWAHMHRLLKWARWFLLGSWLTHFHGWITVVKITVKVKALFKVKNIMCAQFLQLCQTLCNPMNYSPPGSSFHGLLQARKLEWVAMPSSRGSSPPKDRTFVS